MNAIDAEMTILEITEQYPALSPVLKRWGFNPQVQRSLAYESLIASCLVHQIPLEDLLLELQDELQRTEGPSSHPRPLNEQR
jgi:hypothetical protein